MKPQNTRQEATLFVKKKKKKNNNTHFFIVLFLKVKILKK